MKSAVKWVGIALLFLVVTVIAALLIIPRFIDARAFREPLEKMVSAATGRTFSVGGDVRLSLFPWAGVSFEELRLGNPAGFAEPEFVTIKAFEVRVKLLPLLFRDVRVDRLVVSDPVVFLVKNKDGRVNYDFGSQPAAGAKPAAPGTGLPFQSLAAGEVSIREGGIALIDHKKGSRHDLSGVNLSLKDVTLDRPVEFSLSAAVNRKPVSAQGRFGPVGENIGKGRVPVQLTVEAAGQLKLLATGALENLLAGPRAEAAIDVAEFSPRKLLAEFGLSPPATADPNALERLSLKAAVKAGADSFRLSDGTLELDQSKVNFNLTAKEFNRPSVAFELSLDQIDLDRYLPPPAEAKTAGPAPSPAVAANAKTDYGPLRRLVMDGTIQIGRLAVAKAKVDNVTLKIFARDGVLSADPFDLKLYQGRASGKAVVNVKGERPVTEVQLAVDQVQANPLLKDLVGKDFIEGAASARLGLSLAGEDPASLKQSLNGQGRIDFADGAVVGVDLANMVRNVKTAFAGEAPSGPKPRTDFSELAVPFTIQNGVFRTPEALLRSPLLRLQAAGSADLVREILDFRVEPKLVGTIKGQGDAKERTGLSVPVLVSGSFASPVFRPDLESLARDQLKGILPPTGAAGGTPLKEKAGGVLRNILPGKK
ncbi:MAG: AsmA family protein [Desulfobacterales bacterium]|nr:AsmA family protein [Desulfobacterales bacterium]